MRTEKAAELIRLVREDAGMTQGQLALAAKIQQPTVSAYESGAKRPREDTLRKILAAAGARPSMSLMVYADDVRRAAEDAGLTDVRVFGSAVAGRDTATSDIDLLVHARPDTSIFDLAAFSNAVTEITGFPADVLTDRQASNPFFSHVLAEAVAL